MSNLQRGGVVAYGEVLGVDFKSGTSGSGKDWSFHIVSLLTGKTVTEIRWEMNKMDGKVPSEGEHLALVVEFSTYGGRLSCDARGWAPQIAAAKAS